MNQNKLATLTYSQIKKHPKNYSIINLQITTNSLIRTHNKNTSLHP